MKAHRLFYLLSSIVKLKPTPLQCLWLFNIIVAGTTTVSLAVKNISFVSLLQKIDLICEAHTSLLLRCSQNTGYALQDPPPARFAVAANSTEGLNISAFS